MALVPTTEDEPAVQVALTQIIVKLLLGISGGIVLRVLHLDDAALTAIITAVVAAILAGVQGHQTRAMVYSPASKDAAVGAATADTAAALLSPSPEGTYGE